MKIGIFLPQLGSVATQENVKKISLEAESLGYDSLWVLERQLWPTRPKTRYPASSDGTLPQYYKNVLDPIETLSYVAGITKKIKLGTSVIDILLHSPVILGRRLATLDVLSNGRLIAGFGLGWSSDEYQIAGVPFEDRGRRADEFLEAIKAVWTQEIVEYHGRFYKIPPSVIGPKPVQKPHPQIYLGGAVRSTFSRIAKYASGWLGSIHADFDKLQYFAQVLKEEGKKTERTDLKIILLEHPAVADFKQEKREPLTGTIDEIVSDLKKIESCGVEHIILSFRGWDVDKILKNMRDLKMQTR